MNTAAILTSSAPSSFLRAFSMASSASLAAILFSVGTTKILAVVGGPEGMAVMGLYRNLGGFLTVTMALGFGTVIVQKVSVARTAEDLGRIGWAAIILLGMQCVLMAVVALLAAPGLAAWIFNGSSTAEQLRDVRIVIAAAFINLALQLSKNVLNRTEHLNALSIIQILTAASSLALIYPLMKLGSLGLAVNVASGGILGLALSAVYLWKAYESPLRAARPASGVEFLSAAFRPSVPFVFQSIVSIGCLLSIQAIVHRGYGLRALGMINAAMLITDTLGMVIVAPVKSFFLPEFSALSGELEKEKYFARMLGALLCFGILASIGVLLVSKLSVTLLFSADFDVAGSLLAICGLSMIGHAACWSYHLILLNKVSNNLIFTLDAAWSLGALCLITAAIGFGLPLSATAWVYAICYVLYGVGYTMVVYWVFGRQWLAPENYKLMVLGGLSVFACYWLSLASFPACIVVSFGVIVVVIRHLVLILNTRFDDSRFPLN